MFANVSFYTKGLMAAVAIVGTGCLNSALAVSPYDLPYGIQWSHQAGNTGENRGRNLAVTSDGNIHMLTRAQNSATFGEGSTNSINSDVAGFTPQGDLIYGTTISSLPGMSAGNQNYASGAAAVGDKVYFTIYNNSANSFWQGLPDPNNPGNFIDEDGKTANHPMVWSLDSSQIDKTGQLAGNASLVNAIGDRRSLSTLGSSGFSRLDPFAPITTGLNSPDAQIRLTDSAMRTSTLDLVMTNDMVNGDFGTAGDYGGIGQRLNGTNAYLPGIAVYNHATNTLTGPAKQPTLGGTDVFAGGSNMGVYSDAEIDQGSGWYYGGGLAHSRAESTSTLWDPDGSGPAAAIPFVNSFGGSNSAGIGTAYGADNSLKYAVTWDSSGFDAINAIGATNDGTNSVIWGGERNDNAYFEKRDSTGAMLWGVDLDLSLGTDAERVTTIAVDDDGDIWVQGYFTNTDGFLDSFITKRDSTGAEIWTNLVNLGTSDSGLGYNDQPTDAFFSKEKIYQSAETTGTWTNTTGHFNPNTGFDLLLQKLVPGDFNDDGLVDSADITLAEAALAGGPLVGNNTYDFNGDGDSTSADISYWKTNILDMELAALLGDTNNDGTVDTLDIDPFVLLLTNPAGYAAAFPGVDPLAVGDINLDTVVDTLDIDPFVALLTAGSLNGGAVPEPGSIVLLGLAGVAGFTLVRRRM